MLHYVVFNPDLFTDMVILLGKLGDAINESHLDLLTGRRHGRRHGGLTGWTGTSCPNLPIMWT